jgi:tetratricopeptide (TPR) repeat protein
MVAFSQNEQLAQNYYDRGEFEKALLSYEELLKVQPNYSSLIKLKKPFNPVLNAIK